MGETSGVGPEAPAGLWGKLFESLPRVIAEAAKAPYGIGALLILVAGILAYVFFRDAQDYLRIVILLSIVGSLVVLVLRLVRLVQGAVQKAARGPTKDSRKGVLHGEVIEGFHNIFHRSLGVIQGQPGGKDIARLLFVNCAVNQHTLSNARLSLRPAAEECVGLRNAASRGPPA